MHAVFKKEIKSYLNNMIGYIFISFLLLITGIFCTSTNFVGRYPSFEVSLSNVSFIFLLIVPILTMRSLAEERRQKTDQLLYSLPLGVTKVVLGKFFAMLTIFAIPVVIMMLYPLILSFYGTVNFLSAYSALIGFIFLGAALISIGMFASSLTESTIIAAVISFGIMLLIYLMSGIATLIPSSALASFIAFAILIAALSLLIYYMTHNSTAALCFAFVCLCVLLAVYYLDASALEGSFSKLLNAISVYDRFGNFVDGIFDVSAIVYYISVIVVCNFLSILSVEKRRWS